MLFCRVIRTGFTEKETSGSRHEGGEGESHIDLWELHSRQKQQTVQRPWGKNVLGVFEKPEKGQWDWGGVNEE